MRSAEPEELFEGRSSQLYTQLMQLKRKPEKNSGLYGIRTLDLLRYRFSALC